MPATLTPNAPFDRVRLSQRVVAVAVAATLLLGGVACGKDHKAAAKAPRTTTTSTVTTASTAPPTTIDPNAFGAPAGISTVAQAQIPKVQVYDQPNGLVVNTLSNPNENGAPLVFLVVDEKPGWLHVDLPVRPNGSTGWIKQGDVTLSQHQYRIDVSVSQHKIVVMNAANQVLLESVAVGTSDTPTPGGTFYIKELLQPPDPSGPYGPYAYGLSGFSNQLTSFNGGPGVIGIHGTNEPQLLGTDVSHGCIRMSNDGITKLAKMLPLGVPVRILA